jgi:methylmalonyl-CoA mutase N-terminal domain/subunit
MPTLMGYDPTTRGHSVRSGAGVAIDSFADMETFFSGIRSARSRRR